MGIAELLRQVDGSGDAAVGDKFFGVWARVVRRAPEGLGLEFMYGNRKERIGLRRFIAEVMEELLSEKRQRKVEIHTPQRGQKRAMLNLAQTNAKHSFDARFRVLKPSSKAIQEAVQDTLNLPSPPSRIS